MEWGPQKSWMLSAWPPKFVNTLKVLIMQNTSSTMLNKIKYFPIAFRNLTFVDVTKLFIF